MTELRNATADEVRECALRSLLPHSYGTEEAQKAARKADERAAKLNADKLAEREEANAQWTELQHRSLAGIIGREEIERRYHEQRAAEAAAPEAPQYTAEQLATLAAASIDPATADPETVAAVLAAASLGK
jgi:pimeloyl-ACP methyl ester carboxylesterase